MRTVRPVFFIAMLLGVSAWNAAAAPPSASASPSAPASTMAISPASGQHAKAVAATSRDVDGLGPSVDSTTLATLSGGTQVSEKMTLNGTVSNNSADHVVTGANAISGNSFSGAAGLPMVIQNTGNNVLIQNATIVNVQFQP
ncbi:hypothetical protein B0E50_13250 [Rhodanobacter sp. C01]|nr:hypothetical protein B0E50_13250 [Rhodanobacter sp. C01]